MHGARPVVVVLCFVAIASACGGSSGSDASEGSAGSDASAATGGATTDGGTGGTTGGGGGIPISGGTTSVPDAFTNDVVLADAAPFDCNGCACDGMTHYCKVVSGGKLSAPPMPDAGACPDDGGTGCLPLPPNCGSQPSCACVPFFAGPCSCMDVGGGLQVFCSYP